MISTHTGGKKIVMLCVKEGIDVSKVAAITGNNPQSLKQYYDLGVDVKRKYLKVVSG